MDEERAREALIEILRLAFSGERAAALAYGGHAASVRDPEERGRILAIEEEEWRHRREVGAMLNELGVEPSAKRERRALLIGRVLAALCRVCGRLAPLWGAGKLESRNVGEYELAARLARDARRGEWVEPLLAMAEVEWEHEAWFRARVRAHPLGKLLPLWPAPPPKARIRASFLEEEARGTPARRPSGAPRADAAAATIRAP